MSFQLRLVQVQMFCCLLRMLGVRISCLVQVPIFQMFCCLLRKLGMRISCLVQVQMFCCLFRMLGMRISCLKGKCSAYNNRRSAAGLLRDYLGKIITRTDYLGKIITPLISLETLELLELLELLASFPRKVVFNGSVFRQLTKYGFPV